MIVFFHTAIFIVLLANSGVGSTKARFKSYEQEGDVIIGGLFPLHYKSKRPDNFSLLEEPLRRQCLDYNFLGFRWFQAMIFAIEEINNRSDLLPGVKLGFQMYDTCNTRAIAVCETLELMEKRYQPLNTSISVVIGPTSSDTTTATSNILSVYNVPQISYGATSDLLSDKSIYSSFLRTIPRDDDQAQAIIDLLVHYRWTWIGIIASDDEYGRPGVRSLKQKAAQSKATICMNYVNYVSQVTTDQELTSIAQEIKDFNATVFVMFVSATTLKPLAEKLLLLNVSKTWIATEAWATSETIRSIDANLWKGTLGVTARGGMMDSFRSFLKGVSPQSQPGNPFIPQFWEEMFNCSCPACSNTYKNISVASDAGQSICNGTEQITFENAKPAYLKWFGTELEKSYHVYLAVYVVAYSLQDITNCVEGSGLLKDGKCPNMTTLEPWQILAYMKNVDFLPLGREFQFNFDKNHDPYASYQLVNWVPRASNLSEIEFMHVGNYSIINEERWSFHNDKIYWRNENVPDSVCSPPCQPGDYRVRLLSVCCYVCYPCPAGEYSTNVNSNLCMKCNATEQANVNRTGCTPKTKDYIRWNDGYGISFCVASGLGVLITIFTLGVFVRKRNTPVVKATNRELSFVMLFAIAICFLTPLLFIVVPQDWSCRARMISYSLSFSFCIAIILVKTLRVLVAFEARVPVSINKRSRWLGEHMQLFIVLIITLVQVGLCVTWLIVDPPRVYEDTSVASSSSYLVDCVMGNWVLLGLVYGYICLLALVAFALAFRARKLPANFNEAKFITFSLLIFFIVWLSFVPAYLTTEGSTNTAVNCIAILASTYGILGCIFFPKLYIIFIKPTRNTTEQMRLNTVSHAFRQARRISRPNTSATIRRYNSGDALNNVKPSSSVSDKPSSVDSGMMMVRVSQNNDNNSCNGSINSLHKYALVKNLLQGNRSSINSESNYSSSLAEKSPSIQKGSPHLVRVKDVSSIATKASDNDEDGAQINLNVKVNVQISSPADQMGGNKNSEKGDISNTASINNEKSTKVLEVM